MGVMFAQGYALVRANPALCCYALSGRFLILHQTPSRSYNRAVRLTLSFLIPPPPKALGEADYALGRGATPTVKEPHNNSTLKGCNKNVARENPQKQQPQKFDKTPKTK